MKKVKESVPVIDPKGILCKNNQPSTKALAEVHGLAKELGVDKDYVWKIENFTRNSLKALKAEMEAAIEEKNNLVTEEAQAS